MSEQSSQSSARGNRQSPRAARALFELTRARALVFSREPEAIFWVFVFPLVLALVLGFAFSEKKVDPTRIGLLPGPHAAEWESRLAEDPEIEVVPFGDEALARHKLRKGTVDGVLRPDATPELRYDAARPEGKTASLRVERLLEHAGHRANLSEAAPGLRTVTNSERGSRYIDFLFPGLIGMNIMGSGIWGIGFGLVDTRQKKLLKRLLVTPMRRSSFLLSFVLSRFLTLVLEVTILVSFGVFVLDIPFAGSPLGFGALCILAALSFSGLGLLVAARARTIEAVSGLTNLVMMPMWLGSGVFFSYERFPEFMHPVLRLLPLTALNDALRAVLLDGATGLHVLRELTVLSVFGALAFLLALKIFRWE